MPKRYRTKLTSEEFENSKVPSNHVVVELLRVEEDAVTHGGLAMGMYEDDTWEDEGETHPADIASVVGIVRKVPDKLTFGERDGEMPWETEMELQEGDQVWFNFLESKNAVEFILSDVIKSKVYRILPYQDVYCAQRGYWINKWEEKRGTMTIMLNGYCLLEQVKIPPMNSLDVVDHGVYNDRGIVRYLGKPNKKYINPAYRDNTDLKIGDMAFIQAGYTPFLLERRSYFSCFEGNKLFWCVQRRRITFSV